MEALTIETSRDLGSAIASPRTKLRADTWLAILQGISPCYHTRYSLHCKQCGLYETSPTQAGSLPVTIETRVSFPSSTQTGSLPVTIETRASFLSSTQAGSPPVSYHKTQDISSIYGGCSPSVTIETRHIFYLWRVFPIWKIAILQSGCF